MTPLGWHHVDVIRDTWNLQSGDTCHPKTTHLGTQKHHIYMSRIQLSLVGAGIILNYLLSQSRAGMCPLREERKYPLRSFFVTLSFVILKTTGFKPFPPRLHPSKFCGFWRGVAGVDIVVDLCNQKSGKQLLGTTTYLQRSNSKCLWNATTWPLAPLAPEKKVFSPYDLVSWLLARRLVSKPFRVLARTLFPFIILLAPFVLHCYMELVSSAKAKAAKFFINLNPK